MRQLLRPERMAVSASGRTVPTDSMDAVIERVLGFRGFMWRLEGSYDLYVW